jgi:hypothetical protein
MRSAEFEVAGSRAPGRDPVLCPPAHVLTGSVGPELRGLRETAGDPGVVDIATPAENTLLAISRCVAMRELGP